MPKLPFAALLAVAAAPMLWQPAAAQSEDRGAWLGEPNVLLRILISQARDEARPGQRANAVRQLQSYAAEAARNGSRSDWIQAQLAIARLALDAAGDEVVEVESLAVVDDALAQARRGGLTLLRIEALQIRAECLAEADHPLAAARDLELAAGLAFDLNRPNEGIESLLGAARIFRNLGHAARVRQLWSFIDLVLARRSDQLLDSTLTTVERSREAAKLTLALTPEPAEALEQGVDFQPLEANVVVSTHSTEDGRARFLLINHGLQTVEGTLTVHAGLAGVASWQAGDDGQMIFLDPARAPEADRRSIRLLPGQRLRLFLEYKPRADSAAFSDAVTLVWKDAASDQPAGCTFDFRADVDRPSSVVNNNRLKSRPAWPVPLYHEIYYRGSGVSRENLLITASVPCRLEIYNEDTGELIAVDQEGDGDYQGPGDLLPAGNDRDDDGRPDVLVSSEANVASVEVYAFQQETAGAQIAIHLADYSARPAFWRKDAVDQVAP